MGKPIIGITALIDYQKDSFWMLPGYMEGIREAGGIPVMLPAAGAPGDVSRLLEAFDGVLIAGGQDVSPEVYGEDRLSVCGETSPERDVMDAMLFTEAVRRDMPVLGICRGIQFINARLGGTLYQDLPAQHPSDICHRQPAPYDKPIHDVQILPGTPLWEMFRTETVPVNSCHHQAIKETAPGLEAMAVSEDGLVEAVYLPQRRFVWAVQWHPEFSHRTDENSRKTFKAFVRACM